MWERNSRVVIIPSFLAITFLGHLIYHLIVNRFQFIPYSNSYLGNFRSPWLAARHYYNFYHCLGEHVDSNSFGRDHGHEHPGDGLDRIQDPQGVLGS